MFPYVTPEGLIYNIRQTSFPAEIVIFFIVWESLNYNQFCGTYAYCSNMAGMMIVTHPSSFIYPNSVTLDNNCVHGNLLKPFAPNR